MKRCLWRLARFGIAGCLILYVSSRIQLTDRAILLDASGAELCDLGAPQDTLDWAARAGGGEIELNQTEGGQWRLETAQLEHPLLVSLAEVRGPVPSGRVTIERRPGLLSTLGQPDLAWATAALASVFAGFLCAVLRWTILLRALDVSISYLAALRLSLAGLFFNHLVPSSVGGDVLKAVFVSRQTSKKAAAVLSIGADRLLGLTGIMTIAALSALLDPVLYIETLLVVLSLCAVAILGALLVFSARAQRALGLQLLIPRLPGQAIISQMRDVAKTYRSHKATLALGLGLSVLNHIGVIGAYYCVALSLGLTGSPHVFFSSVPMIDLAGALPITPGGWGTGEAAAAHFFGIAGIPETQAVATSIAYRILALTAALPGAFLVAFGLIPEGVHARGLAKSDKTAVPLPLAEVGSQSS